MTTKTNLCIPPATSAGVPPAPPEAHHRAGGENLERSPIHVESNDALLLLINIVERLSILSDGILASANSGEPYETLVRQIRVLHQQHVELEFLAAQAKQCPVCKR
jgi:hypothetical protein